MTSLGLPHWLMIAGTLLVVAGFVGVLVSGKKADEVDPLPNQPTDTPRQQMPPLPSLLDFQAKEQRLITRWDSQRVFGHRRCNQSVTNLRHG